MSSAFEQAKAIRDQNRVLTKIEQVKIQMFPFHGHEGCQFNEHDLSISQSGKEIVKVTITGHVIQIQAGPKNVTCYDMEAFNMEFAQIMSRYM